MPPTSTTPKLKAENGHGASSVSKTESPTDGVENDHLKELHKTLRNATKKLNASAKVDAILAENPDKSLDQLVEEKKINSDQKAQHLRKATLLGVVANAEEQIAHYKQFAAQYEERLVAQKAELTKAHKEEFEAVRRNAIVDAAEASKNKSRQELYTLTKFLCGAATLRGNEGQDSIENHAFEGVLYQIYGGSQESVSNMLKLVNGVDEKITSVDGKELDFTYADVKKHSDGFAAVEESSDTSTETIPASDPTLANAGLTELQDSPLTNGAPVAPNADSLAPPAQTLVDGAGNNVAEKSTGVRIDLDKTDVVTIPRDPAETETGLQATPASADAGLSNGSAGADAAGQGAQESKAKKSGGRRRQNNRPRDGQQAREGQQPQREGQKSPREAPGKRGEPKAQREQGEQAPREGQQVSREGRGRGGSRGGSRGGRGGRGRGGRGAQGAVNGSAEPSVSASKASE